jgi:nicotinate-nucleotide adenylyltransferase
MTKTKKIHTGLFFGSFNPVHIGHMALANYMLEYSPMQEVWFVVSPQNPFKQKKNLLHQFDRLDMVRMAINDKPGYRPSDIEFNLPKPSYTVDTLAYLREKFPSRKFSLIMGADGVVNFHRWKNADIIMKHHERFVYPRHGADIDEGHPNMKNARMMDAPRIEISSSFIRQAIKEEKNMEFYLPPGVYNYIQKMNFYQ